MERSSTSTGEQRRHQATWHAVVLHWGRLSDTAACLASIAPLGFDQILLVDGGTGAVELDQIAAAVPSVKLVHIAENLGYGAGNNVGLRMACRAGAEFVTVCNNDVIVEYPDLINDAETAFREGASVGVLSPQVFYRDGGWRVDPVNLRYERLVFGRLLGRGLGQPIGFPSILSPTLSFNGCCWLVPAGVLARAGFLREDLFLYHEELEYAVRVRQAGFWCAQVGAGRGRVLHRGGTTAGISPDQAYYNGRNQLLVLESFPPASRPGLRVLAMTRVGWMAFRCLKAGRVASAGQCIAGMVDGLRGRRGKRESG